MTIKPTTDARTRKAQPEFQTATGGGAAASQSIWHSLQWWPSLAGAGFAVFVALDIFTGNESGSDLAPIVAASGLVYLAAAALQKPSTAWPAFFVSVVIITAAKMGWTSFDATWILVAIAALLVGYGLVTGRVRPIGGLPLQAVAMLAFGAVAATALYVNEIVGACLVATGLLAHAAWDVYHHRANKVVARSLAEFCFVLDLMLALAIVIVSVAGY